MKYKRYIFPILMGATMSNIMSLVNTGKIVFPKILIMMLLQAIVASLASFVFPVGEIGAKITKKIFPNLNNIAFLVVSSILPSIYFTAILSISGLLSTRGYTTDFWDVYFSSLPMFVLYGYAVSIVWNIVLNKILKERNGQNEK